MGRFSEILLLVSFTLLPSLFVNGGELHPTSSFKPTKRNSVIRGLLVSRQSSCDPGFIRCQASGCCPVAWNCCIDSNCCQPNTYCALASNGIIGCCEDGEICSGPVGGPTTIAGTPTLPTPTVPAPPPVPTTRSVPPPVVPTTTRAPAPVVPTTTVPAATTPAPNPTTATSVPTTTATTTSDGFPFLNAAGQAQLSRPLLVLAGVLVVAMY